MRIDVATVASGSFVLVGASAAAWYLKRRMDEGTGIGVTGWAMTLMVANVLQLVGLIVLLAGLFE
ncbi:MAG TPA: hypothetical protein VEB69_13880 [Acidimicrobiia bacterium]|nr:hypothetical protein [Acidimicrobiia bacterium]